MGVRTWAVDAPCLPDISLLVYHPLVAVTGAPAKRRTADESQCGPLKKIPLIPRHPRIS
jgi:hypothetical protein